LALLAAATVVGGCGLSRGHRHPKLQRTALPSQKGFGNFAVYTLEISAQGGARMFVLNGVPLNPFQTHPPFDSRGTLQLGTHLCNGQSKVSFTVTDAHSGNIFQESIPMRIAHSTVDGRPIRCPLSALSKERLDTLTLRLSMPSGQTAALLKAEPKKGDSGLLSLLTMPLLRYTHKAAVPPSPLRVAMWLTERPRRDGRSRRHLVTLSLLYRYR
jgi:hypothetical protein